MTATETTSTSTGPKKPGEPFFAILAIAQLAVVVAGFSQTFYARSANLQPLSSIFLWHGVVLTLWYVLVIVQSSLLGFFYGKQTLKLHMRLGMLSLIVAGLVVYSGVDVAFTFYDGGTQTEILSPEGLLTANLMNLFGFLVCFVAGMALRRQKVLHKRFLTVAGIVMIGPAAFRLVVQLGLAPPLSLVIQFGLLGAMCVHDRKQLGRISAASWTAAALIVLLIVVTLAVG